MLGKPCKLPTLSRRSSLRTLLARRSLCHRLRPHLRTPTAREAAMLASASANSGTERELANSRSPAPRAIKILLTAR